MNSSSCVWVSVVAGLLLGLGWLPFGCSPQGRCARPSAIRIEHLALNVADPVAVAKWYAEHLAMRVVRSGSGPKYVHFISDADGNIMFELYHNVAVPLFDGPGTEPQTLHIAFAVDDLPATRDRLLAAGATPAEDTKTTDLGDQLVMLRDPWGMPIQLAKRSQPILK